LQDILHGEWGFDGFVESDWVLGTHSTAPAALAGLDIEMPDGALFGAPLVQAVQQGQVPEAVIDAAVRRILRKKFEFHLDAPPAVDAGMVEDAEHVALTLAVERESIVLLKNDAITLPIDPTTVGSIVVVGPLANTANLGDTGSSNSVPAHAVTPLAGIQDRAGSNGSATVSYVAGPTLSAAEQVTIASAGAAVVVVGLTAQDEGEGSDRKDMTLRLSTAQEGLVLAVAALNPHTVVVLEGGSAIVVRPWIDAVRALLMAWYPGEAGGYAIADVLFGNVNPSGKLPISFPRAAGDLPPFVDNSSSVMYGFLHGYRYLDQMGVAPEFAFGFGFSYTSFSYANLAIGAPTVAAGGAIAVTFDVTNSGQASGDEIAELYVGYQGSSVQRAPKDLKAFQRVHLDPGETKTVSLTLRASDLAYWDLSSSSWILEPITYTVMVGGSSRDLPLMGSFKAQ
jgi:beta-glucosidase